MKDLISERSERAEQRHTVPPRKKKKKKKKRFCGSKVIFVEDLDGADE